MNKSKLTKVLPALLLLALGTGWVGSSNAAVPAGITQQGRILDTDGAPVNANVTVVFSIYDDPEAAAAANLLWSETQDITLEDGYFSTRIGEDVDNLFPATVFNGELRYLGVTVGADDEMMPRQRIGSVPYAFMANTADDAVGAIHPLSVTVAGTKVIDETGAWRGAIVDRPFTSLLAQKSITVAGRAALTPVTIACDAGQKVTGGGCAAAATDSDGDMVAGETALKSNYPTAASDGWTCVCAGQDNCNLTAYAICAKN